MIREREASFRGAPFKTGSADSDLGRRFAHHEYPQKDKGWVEDLGKTDARFTVEGWLIGDAFEAERDRLIEACNKPGAGDLVHPYLGRRRCVCTGIRVRQAWDAGRIATVTMEFVEADDALYPTETVDELSSIEALADASLDAIMADALGELDLSGASQILEAATSTFNQVMDATAFVSGLLKGDWRAMGRFVPGIAKLYGMGATLYSVFDLRFAVGRDRAAFKDAGAATLADPARAIARTLGQVRALTPLAGTPEGAFEAQRRLWGWGNAAGLDIPPDVPATVWSVDPVAATTPARAKVAANQASIFALINRTAMVEAARVAVFTAPASYDDAITLRDELADAFDVLMGTAPDGSFRAMASLRASVLRAITTRSVDLPRLRRWTPAITLPALVIAYDIDGDASKAAALVTRNKIRHPGFVGGGQVLEVLR